MANGGVKLARGLSLEWRAIAAGAASFPRYFCRDDRVKFRARDVSGVSQTLLKRQVPSKVDPIAVVIAKRSAIAGGWIDVHTLKLCVICEI